MSLYNILVNIVIAAIFVVIMFYLIGLLAASIALPLVAITLFKVFVVLIAIGWAFGYLGTPITLR